MTIFCRWGNCNSFTECTVQCKSSWCICGSCGFSSSRTKDWYGLPVHFVSISKVRENHTVSGTLGVQHAWTQCVWKLIFILGLSCTASRFLISTCCENMIGWKNILFTFTDPESVKEHYSNLLGDSVDILVRKMWWNHFCLYFCNNNKKSSSRKLLSHFTVFQGGPQ